MAAQVKRSSWGSSGQVRGIVLCIEKHSGRPFAVVEWIGKYATKIEEKLGRKFPLDDVIKV